MILAVLQARMSSRRLPGKVMLPLAGAPMLARQLERIERATRLDAIVVATSVSVDDDPVAALAVGRGAGLFRGQLEDVLDRFYRAAAPYAPSHVVRLTGDCPLADPTLIDMLVDFALAGGYDYASNTLEPRWPDGLDVEIVRFDALESAWAEARRPYEREHVMPFLTTRPDRFKLGSLVTPEDLSGLRWTVDERADYTFVQRIYEALYPAKPAFTTADVLALLSKCPELAAINAGIGRNEGLLASLSASQGSAR